MPSLQALSPDPHLDAYFRLDLVTNVLRTSTIMYKSRVSTKAGAPACIIGIHDLIFQAIFIFAIIT